MNKKIMDAEKDERTIRREFKNAKDSVNEEVEYISDEGKTLRRIQRELVNNVWSAGKESNKKYIRDIEKKSLKQNRVGNSMKYIFLYFS